MVEDQSTSSYSTSTSLARSPKTFDRDRPLPTKVSGLKDNSTLLGSNRSCTESVGSDGFLESREQSEKKCFGTRDLVAIFFKKFASFSKCRNIFWKIFQYVEMMKKFEIVENSPFSFWKNSKDHRPWNLACPPQWRTNRSDRDQGTVYTADRNDAKRP